MKILDTAVYQKGDVCIPKVIETLSDNCPKLATITADRSTHVLFGSKNLESNVSRIGV
ncbi:hypothetical protein [Nostoc sp. 106C]|uniref:hypothetical protein n=1 Tax=Nostoc sp. 106C TaxID=1932667 RepID=UPI001412D078|nr:hypothetical protein [Nostoc sp. 106C]